VLQKYGPSGLSVLGVALENDQREVDRFVQTFGVKYPMLADPDKMTYYLYGVREVPSIYLVDGFGIIRYRGFPEDEESFEAQLDALLGRREEVLTAGDSAPDFTLPEMQGQRVAFETLRGQRKTVMAFFSADNVVCRDQALILGQIHDKYRELGVAVLGIGSGLSGVDAERFVKGCSIKFPFLIDANQKVAKQYQVSRYPEVFVINEAGRISRMGGRISYSGLVKVLGLEGEEGTRELSQAEVRDYLTRAIPQAEEFEAVYLDGETIYVGTGSDGRKEYARFVEKDTLCDVCSDVHFVYSLDHSGVIRSIVMIQSLERYGTPIEGREFLEQFIGKSHHDRFVPGETVDVIAGATKSSLKIIEGLNETEEVYEKYVADPRFDAPYRKKVCFKQQADIEWAIERFESEHGYLVVKPDAYEMAPYFPDRKVPTCLAGGNYKFVNFNNILRAMCTVHGLDPGSSEVY
jgi:peroxiredoxin